MVYAEGPFRNCQVAAPLKRGSRRDDRFERAAFRNCQVAAPLKHGVLDGEGDVGMHLPQLSSCGPIEALSLGFSGMKAATFRNCQVAAPLKPRRPPRGALGARPLPQLSSCGPIEATATTPTRSRSSSLPQLSSCGPIEAAFRRAAGRRARQAFRNCQVAAPLKRRPGKRMAGHTGAFRNCQVAAPLKRDPDAGHLARKQFLPQLSSCGPIEAACTNCARWAAMRRLPQLSSCGPIEADRAAA